MEAGRTGRLCFCSTAPQRNREAESESFEICIRLWSNCAVGSGRREGTRSCHPSRIGIVSLACDRFFFFFSVIRRVA